MRFIRIAVESSLIPDTPFSTSCSLRGSVRGWVQTNMPERVRSIVARLREFFGDRRLTRRRRARLPLTVSLIKRRGLNGSRPQSIEGHTFDLSSAGLSFIVPAIRIDDHYLAGESQKLRIVLELTSGEVQLQAVAVRYERADDLQAETGYLIGVRITQMSDADRERYREYVDGTSGK